LNATEKFVVSRFFCLQDFENAVESGQAPAELRETVRAFFDEEHKSSENFFIAYPKPV